jgi:hypothetical protein
MGVQYQAALVKPPEFRTTLADGSANTVSNVALYSATTSHACNELPEEFHGKYVRITPIGGNLWAVFTDKATHEVDRAIAATAAGARDEKLGGYVANGQTVHWRAPTPPPGGKLYFSREADASTSVSIELASD